MTGLVIKMKINANQTLSVLNLNRDINAARGKNYRSFAYGRWRSRKPGSIAVHIEEVKSRILQNTSL